jgi:hypothetical protein
MALTRIVSPELVEDFKRGGDKLRERINEAIADPSRGPRRGTGPKGEQFNSDSNTIDKPSGAVK